MSSLKVLVLLPMLAVAGQAVAAGYLTLGTWDASLQGVFAYSNENARTNGSPGSTYSGNNSLYELTINNNGFSVINPALVTGSLGITLDQGQASDSSGGIQTKENTGVVGYSFDAEFLNDLPYGGSLFFNRTRSTTLQPFGHQEMTNSNRGVSVRLNEGSPLKDMGLPYLSANLRFEQLDLQQLSTSALNQSYQYSEQRNVLVHDGHKGWETADLDWRYEHDDVKEPLTNRGSYGSDNASLNYGADFGPTLNRRWDSRLNYASRTGSTPISTLSMSELLHISHANNLSTNYNYQLTSVETQGVTMLSRSGAFSIGYQPYTNLGSSLSLQRQLLPTGKIDTVAGLLNYGYQHSLPWHGKLTFRAAGGEQLTETHINNTTAYVYSEMHNAPALLGAGAYFMLDQGFVDVNSITVFDTRLGRVQAVVGIDYTIEQIGNQTHIIPVLGGLIIQAGDPLEVSYTYQVPPSLKYLTTTQSANVVLDYQWITFSAAHQTSDVKLLSSTYSSFLQSTSNDTAQVDLHGTWKTVQGSAGLAYSQTSETLLAYTQERSYLIATYNYLPNLRFAFNADQTQTNYTLPVRQNSTSSLHLSADWYPPVSGMTVNAQLGQRTVTDSQMATETVNDESIKAQLKYGKLILFSSLTASQQVRGGSEMSGWMFFLSVMRRL